MKKQKILIGIFLITTLFTVTNASALVIGQPNTIYMIGASVDAQLYNDPNLTPGIVRGYSNNPTGFIERSVIDRGGIFWGNLPNQNKFKLKYLPAAYSNASSMISAYEKATGTGGFYPIVPGYILVGFVGSICQPNGLADLKLRIQDFMRNDVYSSTTVVFMMYPTDKDLLCPKTMSSYNTWLDLSMRYWYSNVRVINPWRGITYTTNPNPPSPEPADHFHTTNKAVLENATRNIKTCFDRNFFSASCMQR